MMDILMSETYWAHKKWNKIASDIKLVFYSSTITMMHGPINIRFTPELWHLSVKMHVTSSPSPEHYTDVGTGVIVFQHTWVRAPLHHQAQFSEGCRVTVPDCGYQSQQKSGWWHNGIVRVPYSWQYVPSSIHVSLKDCELEATEDVVLSGWCCFVRFVSGGKGPLLFEQLCDTYRAACSDCSFALC